MASDTKRHRPALDVRIPNASPALADLVEAIVDDFRPFAIESGPASASRRVHFTRETDRRAAARAVAENVGAAGVTVTAVDVPDDGADWAVRSQDGLRAVRVGGVIVAPPWGVPAPNPGDTVIVIRPSMGFGTGHHASTRLCLRALQDQALRGAAVIDLGTGSGVLAIAAAKLGARSVVALESDPDAAAAADDNIRTNEVEHLVTLVRGDLRSTTTRRAAQVVVANLTGAVLCQCVDDVAHWVAPGGTLLLAGITRDEETSVGEAFISVGRPVGHLREQEWSCLVLTAHSQRRRIDEHHNQGS